MFLLFKLITVLVAAIVMVLVFKKFSQTVVTSATDSFWMQLLRGFILLVITPIAAILLLTTVFGAYLGLLLFALYPVIIMMSALYSGVIFGGWFMQLVNKDKKISLTWLHALFGVIVLYLVKLIPVIGWIIGFVFLFVAAGTLFVLFV